MRRLLFIPLLLVGMSATCGDSDIQSIGDGLNRASIAVGTAQSAVISAFDAGLIDKSDADAIVTVAVKVARVIGEANALTREFSELPAGSRDELFEILVPVLGTIENALTDEQLNLITDEGLRSKIRLNFNIALAGIRIAQSFLEVN